MDDLIQKTTLQKTLRESITSNDVLRKTNFPQSAASTIRIKTMGR